MVDAIVLCIISVSIITALTISWIYYQRARHAERMYFFRQGFAYEEVLVIQKKYQFRFRFPWLNVGTLTLGISFSLLFVAFLVHYFEDDLELLKGFLIAFLICFFIGISMIVNHLLKSKLKNADRE